MVPPRRHSRIGGFSEHQYGMLLFRPEGTTLSKPRAEARRAWRALAQPWVAYVVHTESHRDGPNPTRIVRPIPVHDAGRVHGIFLKGHSLMMLLLILDVLLHVFHTNSRCVSPILRIS